MPATSRLAPSPTGALHLGNAYAFALNWLLARKYNWHLVLRIEDLDTPRLKAGADTQAIEDLTWLGLTWDEGPHYQKVNPAPYLEALKTLRSENLLYPCHCSRKDIENAASAPHENDQAFYEVLYPGTCRHKQLTDSLTATDFGKQTDYCVRMIAPTESISFSDLLAGEQSFSFDQIGGDFPVWTKAGYPSYQLAVVVDDIRQGITEIVRGNDLLPSTARQIHLYRALKQSHIPSYHHHPLIRGSDGKRLAKRHGDSRLSYFRSSGATPEHILGLIAYWAGQIDKPTKISRQELLAQFDESLIPKEDQRCEQSHFEWLLK